MNLHAIAALLHQEYPFDSDCAGVSVDTRTLKPRELYVAIQGERLDGHEYVKEAQEKGAVAAVVSRSLSGLTLPQFLVPDTGIALAEIAEAHRQSFSCPVIALTGSNGKTTVKEQIAAILPAPSYATKGNLNNHIGVPLCALDLKEQHRYAVFELGASKPGEIAHTVAVVHPDVALINNIAPAHVEGFGSIEGVARAKGEIYQGLSAAGTAVLNEDDAYAHFWDELLQGKKVLGFSSKHPADVSLHGLSLNEWGCAQFSLILPQGKADIALRVPGLHNAQNALAAAACCHAVGISIEDIQKGLNRFTGVPGRMTVLKGKKNTTVIDDTYNANLRSVLAALDVLSKYPGKKILVFGDMGELGAWSTQHHQEVGSAARKLGINKLMSCGSKSEFASQEFGVGAAHFSSQEQLVPHVLEELDANTTILVKGSRSSAMEKIVHELLN